MSFLRQRLLLSMSKLNLSKGLHERLVVIRKQVMQASSTSGCANESSVVSAGIIIIGDEIVKGQVRDSNSPYISQQLHRRGVQVNAIATIPDDFDVIGRVVKEFSDRYTYVITAGGIGPTHDDITFEAIAKAFNQPMRVDQELETLYKNYFKDKYAETHRKLATIPETASLFDSEGKFPIVQIRNIFILPGVPKFLKLAFSTVEAYIGKSAVAQALQTLYLVVDEMSIASDLTLVDRQFPEVTIGSYPVWDNNYYRVRLVLQSAKSEMVEQCVTELRKMLPEGSEIDYNADPFMSPTDDLEKIRVGDLEKPLTEALAVCTEALRRYKLNEICIGFNGGKDCTALLHIWYAIAIQHKDHQPRFGLQAIHIRNTEPFPEEELFIDQCVSRYNLAMMRYTGPIKEQLAQMKLQHPNIKAVIMGTRFTDPHGEHLNAFQLTDQGWPELMRVNPILSFSYSNVWTLLRSLSLPYCRLYDAGYTSLGSRQSTQLNPALKYTDSDGQVRYRPAYTLSDQQLERSGRIA